VGTHRHDVVVVGARAAGAATALLLGRLGYDVVLVDRVLFPADTISTHQIARTGVVALHRWGLLPAVLASGAPAIRRIEFTAAGGECVTRTIKDRAGVHMRLGVAVSGVHKDDTGRVVGVHGRDRTGAPVRIDARFVVGADGLSSRVARSVGAEVTEDRGDDGAVQYAYFAGLDWPGIELFIADRALAGAFPTHDGEACIWVCAPSTDARAVRRRAASRTEAFLTQLHHAAPGLSSRLRAGRRTSAVAGMLRAPNQLRRAHGRGWALVGDAGYHRDAVTGYGISDAYRDAELLAVALHEALRGDTDERTALAGYQRRRNRALRGVFELTCSLAAYPPVPEFVALQKQLGRAIDAEAAALADRPVPGERELVGT
jgi:flavin-dependent dehydrogenase